MIMAKHEKAEMIETEEINLTDRGAGGFGHSGKK
jgi:dUTP pyrophosphatase